MWEATGETKKKDYFKRKRKREHKTNSFRALKSENCMQVSDAGNHRWKTKG
jgi:hypothetical protein